jgi:hypothetical protein
VRFHDPIGIAVAAVALVLGSCSSSSAAEGVTDEDSALAVIENAHELYNSGDAEAWTEVRDRGSWYATDDDRQEMLDSMSDRTQAEIDAGARYEDIECVSEGPGEWPVADAGPVAGYYFICETTFVSDSTQRAEQFEWVVSQGRDGAVVAVRSNR